MTGYRALFLDRDGVINRDDGYVYRRKDFHFIDGIFELTAAAVVRGFLPIIITNQSGIGRGYYSEHRFLQLMRWVRRRFHRHRAPIAGFYFCPFHPENAIGRHRQATFLRKPPPGMLLRAAADFHLDLQRSLLVGDSPGDMEAGRAAGVGRLFYLCPDATPSKITEYDNIQQVSRLADIIPALDS